MTESKYFPDGPAWHYEPSAHEQTRLYRRLKDTLSYKVDLSKKQDDSHRDFDVDGCIKLLNWGADPTLRRSPRYKQSEDSLLYCALLTGKPVLLDLIWMTGGRFNKEETKLFQGIADAVKTHTPQDILCNTQVGTQVNDAEWISKQPVFQRLLALEKGDINVTPESLFTDYGKEFDIDKYLATVPERSLPSSHSRFPSSKVRYITGPTMLLEEADQRLRASQPQTQR